MSNGETTETCVFMNSDGGEEAAKEMVNLMESLVRVGCKENLKVTFNLPPKVTKRFRKQKIKIIVAICKAVVLMNKIPIYRIIKARQIPLLCRISHDKIPASHSDTTSIKTDVGTETSAQYNNQDYQLVNYCQFMGQQLEMLTVCLKKMIDLVDQSVDLSGDENEQRLIEKDSIHDKSQANIVTDKVDEQIINIREGKDLDEYNFVLQQLYENFDIVAPQLENNSENALDLLKIVLECKGRINRVEQKIMNYVMKINEEQDPQACLETTMTDKIDRHSVKNESTPIKENHILETHKFINYRHLKNNCIKNKNDVTELVNDESTCVLLPKRNYMLKKSNKQIRKEFDLYILQKVGKYNGNTIEYESKKKENENIPECKEKNIVLKNDRNIRGKDRRDVEERNITSGDRNIDKKMKPLMCQPLTSEEDSYTSNSYGRTTGTKTISIIEQKPVIGIEDAASSNFDAFSIFPGKPNIEETNSLHLSVEDSNKNVLKDYKKNLKGFDSSDISNQYSNSHQDILGDSSYFNNKIKDKKLKKKLTLEEWKRDKAKSKTKSNPMKNSVMKLFSSKRLANNRYGKKKQISKDEKKNCNITKMKRRKLKTCWIM